MEITSFYFFSTIPQVVATVIALVGAFHIFRNQGNSNELLEYVKEIDINIYKAFELNKKLDSDFIGEMMVDIKKLSRGTEEIKKAVLVRDFKKINEIAPSVLFELHNRDIAIGQGIAGQLSDEFSKAEFKLKSFLSLYTSIEKRKRGFIYTMGFSIILIIVSLSILSIISILTKPFTIALFIIIMIAIIINLVQVYNFVRLT